MRVDDSTRDAGRIGGELRSERHESGFGGGAGAAPGGGEADQGMGVGGDEGAEGGGAVDGVQHGVVGRVASRFDCVEPRCLLATSDIPLFSLLIISLGVKKEVK